MHFHKHSSDNKIKESICPWRLSFILDNNVRRLFHNPYKLFNKFIHENQKVADVGCGPGFFTIDMAKMVGDKGKVTAIDLQEEMLNKLRIKAIKSNVANNIIFLKAEINKIEIKEKQDFILLFYMAHEVQDIKSLFIELKPYLKNNGIIFLCEPKLHVSKRDFLKTIQIAYDIGFKKHSDFKVFGSRTILLTI